MLASAHNRANASIDEWEEIVTDYGCEYLTTPPTELLPRLTADVVVVQFAMAHANDDAERKELSRVGAMLAAFTAKTTSNTVTSPGLADGGAPLAESLTSPAISPLFFGCEARRLFARSTTGAISTSS
ncbi:hypothetical protein [Dactylosporangium sp. CA-233914]|uniref:hypothetical protein n=1 Tax=Dactylosporangium sp. CA-233914 TaxID=3239934 RepID=UPI003D8EA205